MFARKAHKKHMFICGATWVGYNTGLSNVLTCFQPRLLDDKLVFCFQSTVSSKISTPMLEPSFLSKVTKLTCPDPEFERVILI